MSKTNRNVIKIQRFRARKHKSGNVYYYYDPGFDARGVRQKEVALGSNKAEALMKWAELERIHDGRTAARPVITFRMAAERYLKEVLPGKAPRTREDNLKELDHLLDFFDHPPAPLEAINPVHIKQYMEWRVQKARDTMLADNAERVRLGRAEKPIPPFPGMVRANREKALFSHIYNAARGWGMSNAANPCAGIKGYKEAGRDHYIDDDVYQAIYEQGSTLLQVAMDLADLTGQRPADVRKMSRDDIQQAPGDGDLLLVRQGKTQAKLRIRIEGALKAVLERAATLTLPNAKGTARKVLTTPGGVAVDEYQLRSAWDAARDKAAAKHPALADDIRKSQFRDLRARAGTDLEAVHGMGAARDLLGHTTEQMTRHYVRNRAGKIVHPVQRKSKGEAAA